MSGYVHIRLGAEHYAIAIEHVTEVSDGGGLVPVPGAGSHILGVRNVRGVIMPVVDLAAVLGLGRAGQPERLVEVDDDGRRAAFAVNAVESVGEISGTSAEPETELLAGAVLADDRLIGIIDVHAVFESLTGERS